MKLLTINTHSLQEENYAQKLDQFVESILEERPDLIAMQEVNQTCDAALADPELLAGQYPIPGCMSVRADNHAAQVAHRLRKAGVACYWAWVPIKRGYDKYDEGVAVLSLGRKIACVDKFPVSRVNDYFNWRTRAVLGGQLEGLEDWFYTVHMGWWDDAEDGFFDQWKKLNCCIASKVICGRVWLMGDFNAPDQIPNESYAKVEASGWIDTYRAAHIRDQGITVPGVIDGWREKLKEADPKGMRLDYVWCSHPCEILSSRVMFSGEREPVISDHFGVLIETKEETT